MKATVIVFPGSNCDRDGYRALSEIMGISTSYTWHKETRLPDVDLVFLPGGFSYGDYLRTGAIAKFSPVMQAVKVHADKGGLVVGVCNGFQILLEAGLLPGAMIPNRNLSFICDNVHIFPQRDNTPFYSGELNPLEIPIAHFEGNFFADSDTLSEIEDNGQVLFRYCDENGRISDDSNPNGSLNNIAGLLNKKGNVLGMMPHPERACEKILGSEDGLVIFKSIENWIDG